MSNKRISLAEAQRIIVSGNELLWPEHSGHAAGKIKLDTAESRRLFEYLSTLTTTELENPDDSIFEGLINSWGSKNDPAESFSDTISTIENQESWKLKKVQTFGFGGLNQFGEHSFTFDVGKETWCIEGQNGSGKTSLTSAIIWALTGQVIREHSGLLKNTDERKDVYNKDGSTIGTWPPIAAYPTDHHDLVKPAKVFVKLVFESSTGNNATVYRSLKSFSDRPSECRAVIPEAFNSCMSLIDTGLVMPNRIGHLGFGDRSENLSGAVKILTGLDTLESIGRSAAKLKRGGSRFLNYAKQKGVKSIESDYSKWLDVAKTNSETTNYDFSPYSNLQDSWLVSQLEEILNDAEAQAASRMKTLVSHLAPSIDLGIKQGRDKVKQSVESVRSFISKSPNTLKSFKTLASLSDARESGDLTVVVNILENAENSLELALEWHKKQQDDSKLRFKAEASLWGQESPLKHCPLCDDELISPEQRTLAHELEKIRAHANEAKTSLTDACNQILTTLETSLPSRINSSLQTLMAPDIKQLLLNDIKKDLIDTTALKTLTGANSLLQTAISDDWTTLPLAPKRTENDATVVIPQPAKILWEKIQQLKHVVTLADWWTAERQKYWVFWKDTIGEPLKNEETFRYPQSILGKHLEELDRSLESAKPYDDTASALNNAIEKTRSWRKISSDQKMREDIAKSLSPLSDLVNFVNSDISRSIDALSNRINKVLERIHLRDKLDYQDTAFVKENARKSTVNIHASLAGNFKIDATLVANTSWLRAILWAFIFSLREEIIESLGHNPFPLLIMDDPQVTFDPRNESMWATEIVRLTNSTNLDAAQAIITTHETSFFKTLVEVNKDFYGRYGRIVSVTDEVGVAHIDSDTHIQRLWKSADENNDDQIARDFIVKIRVFLESTLRYVLWGEGKSVRRELLSGLIQRLQRLADESAQPFHHTSIQKLAKRLTSETTRVGKIQDAHHRDIYGVPDAQDIHNNFWKDVSRLLHEAFNIVADFRVYQGDSRQYSYVSNRISFKVHQKDQVKTLRMINTGIAAAAKTDGRAGDGIVTIDELEKAPEIYLYNHDVYRLTSPTLEPVATVGDFLIIKNHSNIESRSLIVAEHCSKFLARRYSEPEEHPLTAVLTAQCNDPNTIADPVLIPTKSINAKVIVGTLFSQSFIIPNGRDGHEVSIIENLADYRDLIDDTRLFKVQGQSAEPIALDGQYLITGKNITSPQEIINMDGRLVIAADSDGTRYFKRLRFDGDTIIVLESLNPDGYFPSIVASLDSSRPIQIKTILPVTGVLFELPS